MSNLVMDSSLQSTSKVSEQLLSVSEVLLWGQSEQSVSDCVFAVVLLAMVSPPVPC